MTSDSNDTQRQVPDDSGPPDAVESTDSRLVVEFTVPTEAFVLGETLTAAPDRIVEFERLVPTEGTLLPYLWVRGASKAFEEAAVADPTVDTIRRVATFSEDALYRVDWDVSSADILEWIRSRSATVLQSEGSDDEWLLKLRLESRNVLSDLRTYCDDREIEFQIVRLYDLAEPKMGQFNMTAKQREALIVAQEVGPARRRSRTSPRASRSRRRRRPNASGADGRTS